MLFLCSKNLTATASCLSLSASASYPHHCLSGHCDPIRFSMPTTFSLTLIEASENILYGSPLNFLPIILKICAWYDSEFVSFNKLAFCKPSFETLLILNQLAELSV